MKKYLLLKSLYFYLSKKVSPKKLKLIGLTVVLLGFGLLGTAAWVGVQIYERAFEMASAQIGKLNLPDTQKLRDSLSMKDPLALQDQIPVSRDCFSQVISMVSMEAWTAQNSVQKNINLIKHHCITNFFGEKKSSYTEPTKKDYSEMI